MNFSFLYGILQPRLNPCRGFLTVIGNVSAQGFINYVAPARNTRFWYSAIQPFDNFFLIRIQFMVFGFCINA